MCIRDRIEGNWLLLREKGWAELSHSADLTLFLRARENLLRERLLLSLIHI